MTKNHKTDWRPVATTDVSLTTTGALLATTDVLLTTIGRLSKVQVASG